MTSTSKLRGSNTYLWCLDNLLGSGSMGHVYVGRHRHTGDKYAIKVFNNELKMMQKDYIKSELEILKQIPAHKNIVNIVDIEMQKHTANDKVVVMELCEGGSLQEILRKPEHFYGLPEEDFLLVFFHIGNAIEYLHQHRVIHRDIKPGNILLCISSDNSHIYKLTDFGTCTHDDQENHAFRSLTGTTEYMHPDLHQALFLDRKSGACYDSTVDLWSFGVTIYQCATGELPFIPLGGIKYDAYVLQILFRDKEPGVISQKQETYGSTVSRKHLPHQCYLTSGTKKKTEELLAMVFDLKTPVKWREFFKEFHKFQTQMKIYVFDVMKATDYTLYLDSEAHLRELKQAIFSWTQAAVGNQLLFWDMTLLCDGSVETKPISQWLKTTADKPLMMVADLNRTQNLVKSCCEQDLCDLPENGHDDGKWARETCGMIYLMFYLVKQNVISQQHMVDSQTLLRNAVDNKVKLTRVELRSSFEKLDLLEFLGEKCDGCQIPDIASVRKDLQELDIANTKIKPALSVCQESRCWYTAEKITKDAEALYSSINKFNKVAQSHNDAEMHKYNKSELRRRFRRIKNLLSNHCSKETRDLCRKLENLSEYSLLLSPFWDDKLNESKLRITELMSDLRTGCAKQVIACSEAVAPKNGKVHTFLGEPSKVITSSLTHEVEQILRTVEDNTANILKLQRARKIPI